MTNDRVRAWPIVCVVIFYVAWIMYTMWINKV